MDKSVVSIIEHRVKSIRDAIKGRKAIVIIYL